MNGRPKLPLVPAPTFAVRLLRVCLEKHPAERYATADELAADLQALALGQPTARIAPSPLRRVWRWATRDPRRTVALVGAVGALVVASIVITWLSRTRAELRAARLRALTVAIEADLNEGYRHLSNQDPTAARAAFARVRRRRPNGVEALAGLCLCASSVDEPEEVLRLLGDASELVASSIALRKLQHSAYCGLGAPAMDDPVVLPGSLEAVDHFILGILANSAAEQRTRQGPARAEHRRDALHHLRLAALTADRPRALYHTQLAYAAQDAGETDLFAEVAEAVGTLWPQEPFAMALQGDLALRREHAVEAVTCYRNALKLRPGSVVYRRSLAGALGHLGEWERARAELVSLGGEDSNDLPTLRLMALVQFTREQYASAARCARQVLGRRREDRVMRTYLGRSLVALRRFDEAISELQAVLATNPEPLRRVQVLVSLGTALARSGREDEAMVHFRELQQSYPESPLGHDGVGRVLLSLGDAAGAVEAFSLALERCVQARTKDDVRVNLASALILRGRESEGLALCREVLAKNPDHVDARLQMGCALNKLARFSDALPIFDALLEEAPDSRRIRYFRAGALMGLTRFEEANGELRELTSGSDAGGRFAEQVRAAHTRCRQWLDLVARMESISQKLSSTDDGVEIARYCDILHVRGEHRSIVALLERALAVRSDLRQSVRLGLEARGARAACHASLHHPENAGPLRARAGTWLAQQVAVWRRHLGPGRGRAARIRKGLTSILESPDFSPIRDAAHLAQLEAPERRRFTRFWRDVESLRDSLE